MSEADAVTSTAGTAAAAERPAASVVDAGDGPAVLLLHGWGASKELMAPISARLRGHRFIVPDLPGFGGTPAPPQAWGPDEYADWVLALLDRLRATTVDVVAHSNGGRVAIALAAAHPSRVRRLVLTDSAGIRPRHGLRHRWRVRTYKLMRAAQAWTWVPSAAREGLRRRAESRGSADYRAATGTLRASMVRLVNSDMRPQLRRLAAPTLLIWGADDTETPLADGRLMERLIPDAGLVVIAGAGHFAYAEQPDHFCRVVEAFLESGQP